MRNYYAVRCVPNMEEKALKITRQLLNKHNIHFIFLKRELYIRKAGKKLLKIAPLFPGYLFLETDSISPDLYLDIQKQENYLWFLKFGEGPKPLNEHDVEILRNFLRFGEVIKPSLAFFDENQRIKIIKGPLEGFEGNIIKVDRRKQRVKIQLNFNNNLFEIDLAFELVEKANS